MYRFNTFVTNSGEFKYFLATFVDGRCHMGTLLKCLLYLNMQYVNTVVIIKHTHYLPQFLNVIFGDETLKHYHMKTFLKVNIYVFFRKPHLIPDSINSDPTHLSKRVACTLVK